MKLRKYMFPLLSLLVVASFVLAACGSPATPAPAATQAPATTKVPVGIVLPTKDESRWLQDQSRFQDALTKDGYDVQILFSQKDSAKEKANVEALISQGIKVLIICPVDAVAAGAAVDEAHAAGIKVISYDRLVTGTSNVDYYVTFDSKSVGAAQAQYLVDHAKAPKGNPLYLYAGAASDNNAFIFFEGSWEVLQPKIADGTFVIKNSDKAVGLQAKATLTHDEESTIIGQITTDWAPNTAKTLAEANLTAAPAADKGDVSILAPNDDTARAISDTFAADKDVKSFVITGQDAGIASIQYIIDGKQSMTVFKDVRTLVSDAIAAAETYLKGGTPEKTTTYNNGKIDVPAKPSVVVTVDQSNYQKALIDSGYYKTSDFTAAAPAATQAPAATTAPAANMDALVAAAKAEGALNVIALPHDWCNYGGVLSDFKAKYGLTINEITPDAGSGDEITAITANKDNKGPQAPDVVDVGYSFGEANKALFAPYKVSTWDTIPDTAKSADGYWYGDYYGVMAFLVNTDVQSKVPQDWSDLLDPAYKGQIALSGDPRTSNQAILAVQASALANGGTLDNAQAGLDFFAKLNKAGNLVPLISNNGLVAKGETPIRLTWDYNGLAAIDGFNGNPKAVVVIPKTGRFAGVYVQAISAYAPHPNAAKLWMEYLYSDAGQLTWMAAYCHPIREADLRARNVVPADISAKLPDVSGAVFPSSDQLAAGKTLITTNWDSAVGSDIKAAP
jgi:putative multiple sugar transport system substrate-binding protein